MLIKVKVSPNSKEEAIIKKTEDSFEIKVREIAERGLANRAVIKILSSYFKVLPSQIKLLKGAQTRNKIFEIKK